MGSLHSVSEVHPYPSCSMIIEPVPIKVLGSRSPHRQTSILGKVQYRRGISWEASSATIIEPQRNGAQNLGWSVRPLRPVKGRGRVSRRPSTVQRVTFLSSFTLSVGGG